MLLCCSSSTSFEQISPSKRKKSPQNLQDPNPFYTLDIENYSLQNNTIMTNIETLKEHLRCNGTDKDIYSDPNVEQTFNIIADILLNKCAIKVGEKRYRMLEIEFYLFSKIHKDIIAYPRTNREGGEWFFHPSGVDLCFSSFCKTEENKYVFNPEENRFGGVLIRSIVEVDSYMNPIEGKIINGPMKCMDLLFKTFGAFDDNRNLNQIASIIESEKDGKDSIISVIRHIPVKDDKKKIQSIFSENYGIKSKEQNEDEIEQWKNELNVFSLNRKWRFFIGREFYYKGYDANPYKQLK